MENRTAVVHLLKLRGQRRFAAGAAAFNGDRHRRLFCKQPVNGCKQRQRTGIGALADAVRRVISSAERFRMAAGRISGAFPRGDFRRRIRGGKRNLSVCRGCPKGCQLFGQHFPAVGHRLRRQGEELRQRFRSQPAPQRGKMHPAERAVERFDCRFRRIVQQVFRSGRCFLFPPDIIGRSRGVANKVFAAARALKKRLAEVLQG